MSSFLWEEVQSHDVFSTKKADGGKKLTLNAPRTSKHATALLLPVIREPDFFNNQLKVLVQIGIT